MNMRVVSLALCAFTVVCVSGQVNLDVFERWANQFKARFCLKAPNDILTGGWKVKLQFTHPVSSLQIWIAKVVEISPDGLTVTLQNQSYNQVWLFNQERCIDFVGTTVNTADSNVIGGTAEFEGLTAPVSTQAPASTQAPVTTQAPPVTTQAPTQAPRTTQAPGTTAQQTTSATSGRANNDVLDVYKSVFKGEGTYYGGTTGGTCSYGTVLPPAATDPAIRMFVALNAPQFLNSVSCGMCLKVTGHGVGLGNDPVNGEFYVFVDNLCPECHAGDVDLGVSGDGRWEIEIQAVQCPVGDTVIQYAFQGSNPYYIKLQVRNARIPITSLQLKKNGQWESPVHTADGHWTIGNGPWPTDSIDVKLTAANGEVLYDVIPGIDTVNNNPKEGLNRVQVSLDSSLLSVSGTPQGQATTQAPTQAPQTTQKSGTTASPATGGPSTGGVVNNDVLSVYKSVFNGEGTYYGGTTGGTCSYGTVLPPAATDPAIRMFVALNAPQFLNSVSCGMCLKVTGHGVGLGNDPVNGEFYVFVDNLCPECHAGDVDLGVSGDGRWDIEIQAVQCPVGGSTIQYAFQGSHQWYIKLQVRNARIPITSLQLEKNGQWLSPEHTADGYWMISNGEWPTGPLNVKLTAANGEVLYDVIPGIDTVNNNPKEGLNGVQVSLDPSLPSVSPGDVVG